jgi:hypothetical protein
MSHPPFRAWSAAVTLPLFFGTSVAAADELTRRAPPTRAADIFPAPDTGPEVKEAILSAMEVKGWGALPTKPGDLLDEVGAKVELCRHITDLGHGNYAYTTTCFLAGADDGKMYLGENEEYKAYFSRKWTGKRAALRALAVTGSSIIVDQLHSMLLNKDDAFIWLLYSNKDGCKHQRYWRLVRVSKSGDLTWLGDDMQEAGGESADLKGKCINVKKKR